MPFGLYGRRNQPAARGRAKSPDLSRSVVLLLSLLSGMAGVIHLAVVPEHLHEFPLFGWFFAVVGSLQICWSVWILARPSRSLWLANIVGNLSLVGLWSVSRIAGIPFGPEPWMPESVGFLDVLCSSLETILVAGGWVALHPSPVRNRRRASGILLAAVVGLSVGATSAVGITRSTNNGSEAAGQTGSLPPPDFFGGRKAPAGGFLPLRVLFLSPSSIPKLAIGLAQRPGKLGKFLGAKKDKHDR
jgi:hypothetical protein